MVILSAIRDSSLSFALFAKLAEEFRAGSVMLFKLCFLCIVMLFNDDFLLLWAHLMYNYVLRDLQIKLS